MGMRAFEKGALRADHKGNLLVSVRLDFTELCHQFNYVIPAEIVGQVAGQKPRQ
jgi:hypothetical protein